jgi:hypothetical protein
VSRLLFKSIFLATSLAFGLLNAGSYAQTVSQSESGDDAKSFETKVVSTRLSAFGVPFKINAQDSAFVEVQLYISKDRGRTWNFFARQSTDKTEFPFQAEQDGEYWFALKTLSRDRQLLPSGDPRPELKILVDTIKPKLDLRVQTDSAGRVICRWQARDEHLAPESLKLMYQPVMRNGSAKPWQSVPVQLKGVARNGAYSDQVGWWPDTTESIVNVAVEITDTAGNSVREDRRVNLPSTSWRNRQQSTALPAVGASSDLTQKNLKPAASGANGSLPSRVLKNSLPKQPDWAYPGWQPPSEQKQTLPPRPTPEIQNNPGDKTAANRSTPPTSQKSPDVVCKNGVCVRRPKQTNSVATPSTAKNSSRRSQIAKQRLASAAPNPMVLVGSPEEFEDPPVPPGYVFRPAVHEQPPNQPAPRVAQAPRQDSVAWESEKENWQRLGSTSNRKFDATITPRPSRTSPAPSPATDVPSNPGKMFYEGNKVVGQSSTKGPSNQYRGNQTIDQLPQPTLLPNYSSPANTSRRGNAAKQAAAPIKRNNTYNKPFSSAAYGQQSTGQMKSVVETSEQPSRATRAPVQIVGSKRFRLNYGIDAIDPSGVDKVVLWMTRNDGQTWKAWGTDPDRRSPFPVEITEDGRYGFRIVVKSRDGLTGQGPSSGDDADIWITVDTQAPLVRITSVPYGRGAEAGRLVINFKAADSFLTLRPIKLSYAANPAGPWEVIKEGVRNKDRYLWKVGREVPEQIFLKIEAIDRAGNIGVHVLNQAVDVSGLVPRGTIHGVTPVGQ